MSIWAVWRQRNPETLERYRARNRPHDSGRATGQISTKGPYWPRGLCCPLRLWPRGCYTCSSTAAASRWRAKARGTRAGIAARNEGFGARSISGSTRKRSRSGWWKASGAFSGRNRSASNLSAVLSARIRGGPSRFPDADPEGQGRPCRRDPAGPVTASRSSRLGKAPAKPWREQSKNYCAL